MKSSYIMSIFAFVSGCVYYADDHSVPNYSPTIIWAEAGCYWDAPSHDYIWYFDSDVTDPDGISDVKAVYADVFDDISGELVDSFELFDYGDKIWFSDWYESSTYLYCSHPYVVDFVAYDWYDAMDIYTTYPLY